MSAACGRARCRCRSRSASAGRPGCAGGSCPRGGKGPRGPPAAPSACPSATLEPSYVISALGVDAELAHSSIRFGLHRFTSEEEVDFVAQRAVEAIPRLRELSPLYEMAEGEGNTETTAPRSGN